MNAKLLHFGSVACVLVASAYPLACLSTPETPAPGADAGTFGCASFAGELPCRDAGPPSVPGCSTYVNGALVCPDSGPSAIDASLPPDAGADAASPLDAASPADAGAAPAATGAVKWGDSLSGGAWIAQSVTDDQGNRYFVGHPVQGSVTLAPGITATGAYVAKVDANGAVQWANSTGATYGYGIARDPATGTIYATLGFNGQVNVGGKQYTSAGALDFLVAKLDASGNVVTAKQFGGTAQDQPFAMSFGGGRISVVGNTQGSVDFGGGPVNPPSSQGAGFVVVLDTSFGYVAARDFGGAVDAGGQGSAASGVAVDASGNTYVCGYFGGSTDFGGGPVAASTYDGYIVSLGPTGTYRWSHVLGSAGGGCSSIAAGTDGNVYAAGNFHGTADFGGGQVSGGYTGWVASYDNGGAYRSAATWSSDTLVSSFGIAVDKWGEAVVTGYFQGKLTVGANQFTANSEMNGYLLKVGANGSSFLWSQQWKGGVDVEPYTVTIDDTGTIGVGGTYFGGPMILDSTNTLPGQASSFYAFYLMTKP
jgi:hypothetical protein